MTILFSLDSSPRSMDSEQHSCSLAVPFLFACLLGADREGWALWVGEGAGRDLEVPLRLGGVFDSPWQLGSLVSVPHKWGFWC